MKNSNDIKRPLKPRRPYTPKKLRPPEPQGAIWIEADFIYSCIKKKWVLVPGYWCLPDEPEDLNPIAMPNDQTPNREASEPLVDYQSIVLFLEAYDSIKAYVKEHPDELPPRSSLDPKTLDLIRHVENWIATILAHGMSPRSRQDSSSR